MQILIGAVGKMRSGPEGALVRDYIDRMSALGRSLGVSSVDLAECEAPKSLAGPALMKREGELLLGAIPEGSEIVILDERGENISSKALAAYLDTLRHSGIRSAAFLIGGADGHGAEIKAQAKKSISFGKATWPHMLVRAMLAEQLYRAFTILMGHPYHRS